METADFYRIVDIDGPDDFSFYDNMAALMEYEEEIPYGLIFDLCDRVDEKVLADLTENYFNELLEDVPSDQEDLYILIENIGMSMKGMLEGSFDDRIDRYVNELVKFREWFSMRTDVVAEDVSTGARDHISVRGAIVRYGAEQYMDEESRFYFDDAMDYDLDEYVFTIRREKDYDYNGDDDEGDDEDRLMSDNYIYEEY